MELNGDLDKELSLAAAVVIWRTRRDKTSTEGEPSLSKSTQIRISYDKIEIADQLVYHKVMS